MNKVDFIRQEEIIYLKSAGRYTEFHLMILTCQVLATKPIGEFEHALNRVKFYRIHNSYIINLHHLVKINKVSGNYCEMLMEIVFPYREDAWKVYWIILDSSTICSFIAKRD